MGLFLGKGALQVGLYEWNKAFLASEKCEQRLVPNNCCQGRCVLADELKPQSQEQPRPDWRPQFVELYYLPAGVGVEPVKAAASNSRAVGPLLRYDFVYTEPPFVPPR